MGWWGSCKGDHSLPGPVAPNRAASASQQIAQPYSMWTRKLLADYMAEQTGIRMEKETVRVHLKAAEIVLSRQEHTISSPDPDYARKKDD